MRRGSPTRKRGERAVGRRVEVSAYLRVVDLRGLKSSHHLALLPHAIQQRVPRCFVSHRQHVGHRTRSLGGPIPCVPLAGALLYSSGNESRESSAPSERVPLLSRCSAPSPTISHRGGSLLRRTSLDRGSTVGSTLAKRVCNGTVCTPVLTCTRTGGKYTNVW